MKQKSNQTRKIIELLRDKHGGSEWANFVELNVRTGGSSGRIDFFAFNLWPSKRFLKVAYEIKVSRADFAREMADPLKRESAERLADECWFAMPVGLVKPDEVPEGWGLIEMVSNGLRVKKRAKQRKVETLSMPFIASLARRSSDPEPELPKAVWLYAGKEMDEGEMVKTLHERASWEIVQARRKALAEGRKEAKDSLLPARRIRDLIIDRLGHHYGEPKILARWLDENLNSDPIVLDWRIKEELRQLQKKIDSVLQEASC